MAFQEKTDVNASLTDLERKLVDLERELASITAAPGPQAPPVALPPEPADPREATRRVAGLRDEIAGLVRFRDQLESAAEQLVTEYSLLVDRLRASAGGAVEAAPLQGLITVDAGPFPDGAVLDVFTSALAHVAGAEDVFVQRFEDRRAELTLRLTSPVDLAARLEEILGRPIVATAAGRDRLTVELASGPAGT
jgi:hypothetical protein